MKAAEKGHDKVVEALLTHENGADINLQNSVSLFLFYKASVLLTYLLILILIHYELFICPLIVVSSATPRLCWPPNSEKTKR